MVLQRKKLIINDHLYRKIVIEDPLIIELIESNEIQRLKKISQLGTISLVDNNINHNRFQHSLGVYHLICETLKTKQFDQWTKKNKKEIAIAGLLHDLGHGPLSHSFEKLFLNFKHEKYSIKLIKNKQGSIYKLLQKEQLNIQRICNLISKKNNDDCGKFFISHQFDFDRIDYLLRDSHHLNLKERINAKKIINGIILKNNQIVFDHQIIKTLEQYLKLRIQIRKNTFWKPKYLLCEQILVKIFKRIRKLKKNNQIKIDNCWYFDLIDCQNFTLSTFLKSNDHNFKLFLKKIYQSTNDFWLKIWLKKILFKEEILKTSIPSKFWSKRNFNFKYDINFLVYVVEKEEILILKNDKIFNLSQFSSLFNETKYYQKRGEISFFINLFDQ